MVVFRECGSGNVIAEKGRKLSRQSVPVVLAVHLTVNRALAASPLLVVAVHLTVNRAHVASPLLVLAVHLTVNRALPIVSRRCRNRRITPNSAGRRSHQ